MSLCWNCCHSYDTIGVHMPYEYDRILDIFSTQGEFCSWMCAKAYAKECHSTHFGKISENITAMRRRMENKTTHTKCALHKSVLQSFGGSMTIEDYRKTSTSEMHVLLPNDKVCEPIICSTTSLPQKAPLNTKEETSDKPQKTLRLSRPKKAEEQRVHLNPQTQIAFRKKVAYDPISPR